LDRSVRQWLRRSAGGSMGVDQGRGDQGHRRGGVARGVPKYQRRARRRGIWREPNHQPFERPR
jgi:hypothetical protein